MNLDQDFFFFENKRNMMEVENAVRWCFNKGCEYQCWCCLLGFMVWNPPEKHLKTRMSSSSVVWVMEERHGREGSQGVLWENYYCRELVLLWDTVWRPLGYCVEHNSGFYLSRSKRVNVLYSAIPICYWVRAAPRSLNSRALLTWPVLGLSISLQMKSSLRVSQVLGMGILHCRGTKLRIRGWRTMYQ